ncbi:NAD-dependent epimerase/dehydratase family protein [Nocardioides dokdonensis]|uniref:NAD-dependent epimerase/dehydratase family protein n=1 Tax=Nocardioides dokdonensis TaxID=450734 RepID=UPI003AAC6D67
MLVGGSGFVGSAVAVALGDACEVRLVPAPRLSTTARDESSLARAAREFPKPPMLVAALSDADVLVNAAGNPDASSQDEDCLFGANALLPAILIRAALDAGVSRFVHVSSAVVQNDRPMLDSTEELREFSPYSSSKIMGEVLVRNLAEGIEAVRYRPPSVHAPSRRVTRMIRRIAGSFASTVASPGTQHTPQALLPNVASAIAYLATVKGPIPSAVHHPSEGVTVTSLMQDLSGGRKPVRIPRWLAVVTVRTARAVGRLHRPTAANARRLELLWLGQEQADSWLTESGWRPPVGRHGWKALGLDESA